jgi:hypothetical protein
VRRNPSGTQIIDDFTSYNNLKKSGQNSALMSQEISLNNQMVSSKHTIHEVPLLENQRSPSPLRMKRQRNSSVQNMFQDFSLAGPLQHS